MFDKFRKQKPSARQPDHTARITPSLSVSVWRSHDSETGVRLHWDVSCISKDDPSRSFKTLRIESILEFPLYLARVAAGFASTEAVSPQLRSELQEFAKDMELLAEKRQANGAVEKKELEAGGFPF